MLLKSLKKIIFKLNLEYESPFYFKEIPSYKIMDKVKKDKKTISENKIELIIPKDIGKISIESYSFNEIEELLERKKDEIRNFSF